ncbi:MAG TPA: Rne/Rng family ribonuclease, partial [Myxococcaceae bacterium]|nr:Rne/Rng family ribonuclease [Myxococcaceae bacterium]
EAASPVVGEAQDAEASETPVETPAEAVTLLADRGDSAPPTTPPNGANAPQGRRDGRGPRPDKEQSGERRARGWQKARRGREREEEAPRKGAKAARIENLLKVGQEVLVQVSKDPIGTKGARLTCHISIPGRHLVFMPTVDHVGISRRISNEKERRRLREMVDRLRPPGTGFIVRTVAENVPSEKLESDIRFLIEVWNQTVRRNERRNSPGLLHPDLDLILRATRDLFAKDVEKLVVDDREEYERILNFVTAQDPAMRERIVLHDNEEPMFDAYGIEQELQRAVQRKVWLKSGGYLIIDQAEALTAVDVNSGRYVGKKSLEETITKINTEAAKEIVYQLRLRNIGGIIICDFIDMEKQSNREKVFKTLQDALGRDKAKTNVLRISELGLVEMTRKRVRESIGRILHQDCSYCEGQGFVKTPTTVCYEIFREIRREATTYKDPTLVVNCHAEVAKLLQGEERQELRHLMDRYNKTIQIKVQGHYHQEKYDIYGRAAHASDRAETTGSALKPWSDREAVQERQEAKPSDQG